VRLPCRVSLACGPYSVEGEGYVAEYVERPPSFTLSFKELNVDVDGSDGTSIFNPFSWMTLSPQLAASEEGVAGCVRLRDHVALPAGVEAGEARAVQECLDYSRGSPHTGGVKLGAFKLRSVNGSQVEPVRLSSLKVAVDEGFEAAASSGSATIVFRGSGAATIGVNTINFKVKLLYFNVFEEPEAGVGEAYEANAITIHTPLGSLSLASPAPMEARIKPGEIHVEASSTLKLALGGELEAYRLLAEALYPWKPLPLEPGKRVPGYWSVSSAAAVTRLTAREVVVKAVNPTRKPGTVSLNPPFPPRAAYLATPLGEEEIVAAPEIRVPAPPCFCGVLRVKGGLAAGWLARVRGRKRV